MCDRYISKAVIGRLPRYYRFLGELLRKDIERVSSSDLARLMNVTASQIRQDFNTFGGFGQQGYGYNVQHLYNEMGKILGVDHTHNMVIIGAGNLARAFTNYIGFNNIGFYITGLFDINPEIIGKVYNNMKVMSMEELPDFVKNEDVSLGILCVPKESVKEAAESMIKAGLKNIWNFAPTDLDMAEYDDVIIKNEHLSDSLIELSYAITAAERKE